MASPFILWSGRADLNRRPPAPKAGALTRLRYVPSIILLVPKGWRCGNTGTGVMQDEKTLRISDCGLRI